LKPQIERINLAGRHVTQHLTKLLLLRGYAFNSTADFETVREIKEKTCFLSCDIALDRKLSRETTTHMEEYRLPDQTLIKVESYGLIIDKRSKKKDLKPQKFYSIQ
jgi:actin-related protein 2